MAKGGFPGMGGGNMQQMLKQAQKMQQQMLKMQEEVEARTYSQSAGGGVVTCTVNGKKQIISLEIKPEAVDPEDVEMLQDLVIASVNAALQQATDDYESTMSKLTGGMKLGF